MLSFSVDAMIAALGKSYYIIVYGIGLIAMILSIIAFQPDCTKLDIETIRGVSSDYAIERLLERELIEISGRRDTPGQPTTYKTTEKFLDYFGIHSVEDLPKLTEIQLPENELGTSEEESSPE